MGELKGRPQKVIASGVVGDMVGIIGPGARGAGKERAANSEQLTAGGDDLAISRPALLVGPYSRYSTILARTISTLACRAFWVSDWLYQRLVNCLIEH